MSAVGEDTIYDEEDELDSPDALFDPQDEYYDGSNDIAGGGYNPLIMPENLTIHPMQNSSYLYGMTPNGQMVNVDPLLDSQDPRGLYVVDGQDIDDLQAMEKTKEMMAERKRINRIRPIPQSAATFTYGVPGSPGYAMQQMETRGNVRYQTGPLELSSRFPDTMGNHPPKGVSSKKVSVTHFESAPSHITGNYGTFSGPLNSNGHF
jgi:hypothetical protein